LHYSKEIHTRTSTSTIIKSYATRAGADVPSCVQIMYILLFAPLTDSFHTHRRIVRADLCFAVKQTQSDQAKRRSYSIRGRGGTRTRSIFIAIPYDSRPKKHKNRHNSPRAYSRAYPYFCPDSFDSLSIYTASRARTYPLRRGSWVLFYSSIPHYYTIPVQSVLATALHL
jgi:hypothetical protein